MHFLPLAISWCWPNGRNPHLHDQDLLICSSPNIRAHSDVALEGLWGKQNTCGLKPSTGIRLNIHLVQDPVSEFNKVFPGKEGRH